MVAVQVAQHVHDASRRFRVERGNRFIGEHDAGALHQCTR